MNTSRRNLRSFDFVLFGLVILLSAFGLLMVGSATGLGDGHFSPTFINQLLFMVTGIGIMLVAAFINFETISKFYLPIYGVNLLFLIVVLLLPRQAGVARWIGIEIGGTMLGIQPSEFAKIFMIIFLAKLIDMNKDRINKLWVVGIISGLTILPVVLIFMQPSWSASIIPIIVLLAMLFVGKISYKYIIITTLVVIPILLFFFIELHAESPLILDSLLEEWQIRRIYHFLYPEGVDTFQNDRALAALSSGLLTGRGLFNNTVRIPEASNDFILSVIGAEFGFLGVLMLLAAFFIVIIRCFVIAYRSQLFLGTLMAVGVGITIAAQVFIHVGVNTFMLPNTGINLPFISSGGSSIWVFMAMIGLVLNVGMSREHSMFDSFEKGKYHV